MKLNYQAFTHPKGDCFAFPAKDEAEARLIIEDYLKETEQSRATVHPWNEKQKSYDYECSQRADDIKSFEVKLPVKPGLYTTEYKLVTRYVRWVEIRKTEVEEDFFRVAQTFAKSLDTLPEHEGWEKTYISEPVHYTDDERYRAETIQRINLDEKPNA